MDYLETIMAPALGYPKHRDTHPGEQGVIFCDGVGVHLTLQMVEKAIELGIEIIILRVPNLSFVLQGEDTMNFKELKADSRNRKVEEFKRINGGRRTKYASYVPLDFQHFMKCFKPAWDKAVTVDLNMAGWRHEGTIPFTQHAFWRLCGAGPRENSSHASNAIVGATSGSLTYSGDAMTPTTEESTPAPAYIMPERVKEALEYAKKTAIVGGAIDVDGLMIQNLRMLEVSKVLAEWACICIAPKPASTRITSTDLHGRPGSATGSESLQVLLARQVEVNAAKDIEDAKRESRLQKKAQDVVDQVQTSARLVKMLEEHGETAINRLTVSDTLALLVNADPQGEVRRPKNKTEGLQRVRGLPTI